MRPGQPPQASVPLSARVLAATQCFAVAVLVIAANLVDDALSSWVWLANLLAVGVLWWLLGRRTRSVADRSASGLDERDLEAHNRVAWWGFVVAIFGGTATALTLVIASRVNNVDAELFLDRAGTTLIALMLLAAVTPTTLLAVSATE